MNDDRKETDSVTKTNDTKAAIPTTAPKTEELDEADLDQVAGGKAGGKGG